MTAPDRGVFRPVAWTCAALLMAFLSGTSSISAQDAAAANQAAAAARVSERLATEAAKAAQAQAEAATKSKDETARVGAEAVQRVQTVSAEMMARAQWLEKIATTTVWLLGVIGMIVGVVAAVGVGASVKKIKASERQAAGALKEIDTIRLSLTQHHLFLKTLEEQVERALGEIEAKLQAELTPSSGLIGVDAASDVPYQSFDDDALIVFADRLRITGAALNAVRMSEFLVQLSHYWRRVKEYDRAIERARRAMELNSASPTAHKAFGRALWNKVAEELDHGKPPSPRQVEILARARTAIEKSKDLVAVDSRYDEELAYDLATIARLSGDYHLAERLYREGFTLSQQLGRSEQREPDWDYGFALACLYAVTGRHREAVNELQVVMTKTRSWRWERREEEPRNYREWMEEDPDFQDMLADAAWKKELEAL